LGFFEEYDLYVGLQSPLPPTLIARHGFGGENYTTLNPMFNTDELGALPPYFAEAFERAKLLGISLPVM
jgi:hypothetical protein